MLAGKAARNCTNGCTFSASFGRRPIQTPTGTHNNVASAISTMTRASVMKASASTVATSIQPTLVLR